MPRCMLRSTLWNNSELWRCFLHYSNLNDLIKTKIRKNIRRIIKPYPHSSYRPLRIVKETIKIFGYYVLKVSRFAPPDCIILTYFLPLFPR
uniref:Uncharacterized protein n=1 Tax=Ciona intestinalis TaxID=7719 RepID=H2XXN1_CIOIN